MKNFTLYKKIGVVFLLLQLTTTYIFSQQVYINEFLASNSNVNVDEFGEDDDWIELYNSSSSPVNIGGYFLTDDLINTTKWTIPAGTTIPGNGFLLFWCDNQDIQGPQHTNFKLGSGGESVALVASDGTTVIDSYTYGPQTANISFGRSTDGGTPWVFFGTPTPEASNGGGSTVAVMPLATLEGGHYSNDIVVELSTTTPGATIRYTLDGSNPTSSSDEYNNALDIDETTVLRARTFKSGMDPSRTMTHTYMYGISHTMPIFCVSTDDDNFFGDDGIYTNWDDDIEVPCHVELYETDGTFGFRQDLGVQVHGGFSQSYPHKGISFVAKNQYGNNKISYPLFPDLPYDEYGSFILRASGNDWSKSLFRDAYATSLVKNLDEVDPMIKDPDMEFQGYRPAIVYLNGEYFGIHNLREKLDWRFLKTHYDIEKGDADIVQKQNGLEHGNQDAWDEYRDLIEDGDFTDPTDYAAIQTWMDLDHYIDYFLHQVYIDNNDWPDNNNKGWRLREEGSTWRYFLYDQDRCFGLIPLSGDYNSGDYDAASLEMVLAETQTEDHNKEWSTLMLRKLMMNDEFRLKFINRMADFLNILYTPDRLLNRLDEFEAVYEVEIDQHAEEWWDNNYYATNIDRARIFANNRTEEMWNQYDEYYDIITDVVDLDLDASPQAGGTIHLNTMNFREVNFPWSGQYFSGVDVPLRAAPNPGYFFTGWTPSALGNDPVTTMNLNGNGDITANFSLGSTQIGDIVINEINYHSPDTCDAGDWIELYNYGTETVDVSGWFLEDEKGNYFNIPQNTFIGGEGYLVLVEDVIRFQNVHPTVTSYVASFGNSVTGSVGLSNGGEWISINNADRSFMDTVLYDDKLPWPEAPDGNGPTLQLIDHLLDNALPTSWAPSAELKGTPGAPHAQGTLYIGENTTLCIPTNVTLDASYSPCFNCTYNWNNGSTNATLEVVPNVGTNLYAVTVTDASGSTQTDEITIDLSPSFDLSYTDQDLNCNSATNGNIDLSVNGTGSFTYQWTNGATTQDLNNIGFGIYTVTVTDAFFCTKTESVAITAPPAISTSAVETGIACNGDLANIDVAVSGGTFPYTYLWSTGATTPDEANLSAGTYALTITDMNSCTEVMNFNYTEPLALTGSFDLEHACGGLPVGTIDVDMEGGSGGNSYAWSNGASGSSDDIENLDAGLYTVTVTDNENCTWVETTEILASSPINGNETVTDLPCAGTGTGSIELNVSGGNMPYDFDWSNNASTATNLNLDVGGYWVTITDATGCEYTDSLTIGSPEPVIATAQVGELSCFGNTNATINVDIDGGSGTYNYAWNTGDTTAIVNNLAAGNYLLTVTDSNGCSSDYSYTVDQPSLLTATVQTNAIACFGNNNGSLSVNANGGTGLHSYLWSNGSTATELTNIAAATYAVTVSDDNGCTAVESIALAENPQILNTINQTNLNCNNTPTGSISLSTTGGQGPYNFLWNNDETTANLNNLAAANYTVTITDNSNCTNVASVEITEPAPIVLNASQTDVACNGGNNGSVTLNPSGGAGPYNFAWNNGATTNQITNLAAGDYIVTITDNNACTLVETTSVQQEEIITSTLAAQNVSCFGMNNGSVSISSEGGQGNYQYLWSNGATTTTVNNLEPSTYLVTVTDLSGCTQLETVNIEEPTELNSDLTVTEINCHDGNDGQLSVSASGGNGDYNYNWNTGSNDDVINNLAAATYTVTITDAAGCTTLETTNLTNPTALESQAALSNINCFGESNGSISLSTNGGAAPYQTNWNNSSTSENLNNLSSGTYIVTVTDNNACTFSESYIIDEPNGLATTPQVQNVSCFDGNNGAINLSVNGGTGAYDLNWSNGENGLSINQLEQGNYIVTIVDENDCVLTETISITQPEALTAPFVTTTVSCAGDASGAISVEANGGISPYNYSWNTGSNESQIEDLVAANYNLVITDNNGCTYEQNIEVTEPESISYTAFQQTNNNCFGENNGVISLNATGGVGNYTYSWSNGVPENSAGALTAGEYSVTITDGNDCTFTDLFEITEPTEITVASNVINLDCYNDNDGSIQVNTSGGTGGYQLLWNTGATTPLLENLMQGDYTLTVTDELACTTVQTFSVEEPAQLLSTLVGFPVVCNDASDGALALSIIGGTAPFTYEWIDGSTDDELNNLSAGEYSVTITDANDCVTEEQETLVNPPILEATYDQVDNECFEGMTGSLSTNISGGVAPYNYNWSNGDNNALTTDLAAAEYTLTLTDANGCSFEETFNITEAPMINIISTINQITCFESEDASISIDVNGGTPGYNFEWSTGVVEDSIGGLSAGSYLVTVTDQAGCQDTVSYSIGEPVLFQIEETIEEPLNGGGGMITIAPTGGLAPYSIEWNTGDSELTISELAGGTYNYTITDANGCIIEGSVSLIDVSVAKLSKGDLNIYPNPTNGLINIEGNFSEMELHVIDLLGRTVQHFTKDGMAAVWSIELGDLADGVYFLRVETETGFWMERVVVE
ncbi:MAG: lamin tail domain-containing protein [Saprospiraceae bacterium]